MTEKLKNHSQNATPPFHSAINARGSQSEQAEKRDMPNNFNNLIPQSELIKLQKTNETLKKDTKYGDKMIRIRWMDQGSLVSNNYA